MYIDINDMPEEFNTSDWLQTFKQMQQVNIVDPTQTINTVPGTTTTGPGLWSQLNQSSIRQFPMDSLETRVDALENEIKSMRQTNKLMRLKILSLEGKFTQEEVSNIKKMIMSEDEAAQTLAETIINNA